MLNGLNAWRAQGAGGGALAAMQAPFDLVRNQQEQQLREINNARLGAEYSEYEKDSPLRQAKRQQQMYETGDTNAAWESGEMGELASGRRQVEKEGNKSKLSLAKLEEFRRKAEWHMMADEYLDSANPADLAGDGWKKVRDQGREVGLDLPDELTPEYRAKIKGLSRVAVNTIPAIQKKIEQERALSNEMLLTQVRDSNRQAEQTREHTFRREEGKAQRDSQERLWAGRDAAGIARARAAGQHRTRLEDTAVAAMLKLGKEEVSDGELAALELFVQTKIQGALKDNLQYKINQVRALSADPAQAAAAEAELGRIMQQNAPIIQQAIQAAKSGGAGAPQAPQPGMTPPVPSLPASGAPQSQAAPVRTGTPIGDQIAKNLKELGARKGLDLKYTMQGDTVVIGTNDRASQEAIANAVPSGTTVRLPDGRQLTKP